jgi:WD40 repeat protein
MPITQQNSSNGSWAWDLGQVVEAAAISEKEELVVAGTGFYNNETDPGDDNQDLVTNRVGIHAFNQSGGRIWHHMFDASAEHAKSAGVIALAVTGDASLVACGGQTNRSTGLFRIYNGSNGKLWMDAQNFKPTPTSPAIQHVNSVAISGNGSAGVAVAGAVNGLYISTSNAPGLWSAPARITVEQGVPDRAVMRVDISNDGLWIVAALAADNNHNGGTIALVNNVTPPTCTTWSKQDGSYVQALAMSGNGKAFVCAGGRDGKVYYFDRTEFAGTSKPKPKLVSKLEAHHASCRGVAISADGTQFAAIYGLNAGGAHHSGDMVVYDNQIAANTNDEPVVAWRSAVGAPTAILCSPNQVSMDKAGKHVAVADGSRTDESSAVGASFQVYAAPNPPAPTVNPMPGVGKQTNYENHAVQISGDGKAIVGGSDSGHVYFFLVK